MIFEILQGIHEKKYTDMRQVMLDFGFSNFLMKTVFIGMVKKGLLKNIDCETCRNTNFCDAEEYCKGFNSYWLLTDKGRYYLSKH